MLSGQQPMAERRPCAPRRIVRSGAVRAALRPLALVAAWLLCGGTPASAEPAPEPGTSPSLLRRVWGTANPSTIYVGMWTRHLTHAGIDNNHAYGVALRGVFAGTFVNSYHTRSYAVALERRVAHGDLGGAEYGVGYRVGAIQGYDRRLLPIAGKVPVVPFVSILGEATWKGRVGVQAAFCVKVVTWGAVLRF